MTGSLNYRMIQLRRELAIVTAQRDALNKAKGGRVLSPLIDIGTTKDGGSVIAHEGGLHVLQCACGATLKKSRKSLVGRSAWRCVNCYKADMREKAARGRENV